MSERPRRTALRLVLIAVACVGVGMAVAWDRVRPYVEPALARLGPVAQAAMDRVGPRHEVAKAAPKEAPAVPVSAVDARIGDFPQILTSLGTVQPYNTVLVRSRVDGQVMTINFNEGQIVHQGDLLVQIDPRPYQAALDQAKAKKQQDAANLDNTKRDLARSQSLIGNNYVTRQTLDTQTASVAQLTAQVASDDAAIENASVQLGYATIKAPITGRVGFRLVDQGNIVNASSATGIVSIAQIEPISVVFTEPENALTDITEGRKAGPLDVGALSSDGSKPLADGMLETFNNEIDTSSGTIRLKGTFANTDHKLWPGLSVSTRLKVKTLKGVVLVPFSAVQHGPDGLYAFVIGPDSKVEIRRIKVSLSDDSTAVVAEGIKGGEKVVTAGQYRLQAKTPVRVVPDAAAQTAQRDS
ncbi:efflux RND transporter periplasmic adaptor subunit [Lichenibacterium ramalinae]|uniref:Efflux RND transporter periplasmic adaptor subunit n=1 Tax=Lichenibacterium ramalinae TaxID=2316527 RepID=A0A4Q2RHR5_9HYPH|nr:efflux RND transporter periplasmic adaptor subunit [Lichenibacterium ramalinae]RYB06338.1 efflux RND transporter periplasmic adaptor subunit [Lichenibacterium ramalinae]